MLNQRLLSVLRQEYYITKRSLEVIFDLFFFTLFNAVLFGYISLYLAGASNGQAAQYVLMGFLLWEVIRLTQYTVTVSSLWNVWSHNLTNVFISPINTVEYIVAHLISGLIKTIIVFIAMGILCSMVFHFNIFTALGPLNLLVFFMQLTIFAWSVGLVLLGLVFRYGTRIQAISWGVIFFFQPVIAAYFPVKVLPSALQSIAFSLPPTYVFEAARAQIAQGSFAWSSMILALALNLLYFGLSVLVFAYLYRKSRETGQFARNDA
jgi:ABC-2 type transport system permease protein